MFPVSAGYEQPMGSGVKPAGLSHILKVIDSSLSVAVDRMQVTHKAS